jgi:hypothetical protein
MTITLKDQIDWLRTDTSEAGKSEMHKAILNSLLQIERLRRNLAEAEKELRTAARDAVAETRWPMDET